MARRNLSRLLGAAALVLLSGGAALVSTPVPAAAAVPITVTISDRGFSQREIEARVGDVLTFQLDTTSSRDHTVTLLSDGGEEEFDFSRRDENFWTLPAFEKAGAEYVFYDRYNVRRRDWHPFVGTIKVSEAPDPDPSSTTTSTTVATTPAPTTTTTAPPSTTTSAPGSIRPLVIPDPEPTSTTTMAPPPPSPQPAEPTAPPTGKDKAKARDKDKDKSKATETSTTEAPAAPGAIPPDFLFDPALLTPGPVPLPATSTGYGSKAEAAIGAAAVADLLLDPASDDTGGEGDRLTMYAVGAVALVFLIGAVWGWQHRSSRYFPA